MRLPTPTCVTAAPHTGPPRARAWPLANAADSVRQPDEPLRCSLPLAHCAAVSQTWSVEHPDHLQAGRRLAIVPLVRCIRLFSGLSVNSRNSIGLEPVREPCARPQGPDGLKYR